MKTFVIHRHTTGENIIACGKSIVDACVWAHRHWPGEPLHIRQLRPGEARPDALRAPITAAPQRVRGAQRRAAA